MTKSVCTVLIVIVTLCGLTACVVTSSRSAATDFDPAKGLPENADIKLYLLAGQSNMAGRGAVEDIDRETHPRVFMLTEDGQWTPAADPIHFDKPKRIGVGPGLAFGKAMADAYPDSVIGLVPSAVGGSSIESWAPKGFHEQTGVHPYDDAIRRTHQAVENSGGALEAILWQQGESDSRRDKAPAYAEELKRLAADFRRELDAPEAPFLVGGLGEFFLGRNTDAHIVQAALKKAPDNIKNTAFVSAEELQDKGDELHFSAASSRQLGERYAHALLSMDNDH